MPSANPLKQSDAVTIRDLEASLSKLTWIIENHSEAAWPLFERLERELDQRTSRKSRLDRHRQSFS